MNVMGKYRQTGHDIAPEFSVKPKAKPGTLPANRIPVLDAQGRRRGHVGYLASENVARRFGVADAKLGTKDGRPAWIGTKPASAGRTGAGRTTDDKHAAQIKQAKGSVSKNPSPPKTVARPKR